MKFSITCAANYQETIHLCSQFCLFFLVSMIKKVQTFRTKKPAEVNYIPRNLLGVYRE